MTSALLCEPTEDDWDSRITTASFSQASRRLAAMALIKNTAQIHACTQAYFTGLNPCAVPSLFV